MTPEPDALAELFSRAFPERSGWGAGDFRDILGVPGAILCTKPGAFALGRVVADEAELLLIATDPVCRRRGLGADCLARFHSEARAGGARAAFLEVGESNRAARALYLKEGYREVGRRKDYYTSGSKASETALILRRDLP